MRQKELAMSSKHGLRWIAATAVLLAGCAAERQYPAPPVSSSTQLVAIDGQAVEGATIFGAPGNPAGSPVPRNVLVLSGGGANGAYTAGVLKGWAAAGTRPPFDVVTGVSTGALIAPYAFLGAEYDAELERLYTSMRRESIFLPRLLLLDSIVSSEPLQQQIAAGATPETLQKIAEAHRQGRRLYVGTTNLDAKQLVVWDMGAIAARNTPESGGLFQKVLLASCSVPGLLPPVPIDIEIDGRRFTELHVDGGVTASLFLRAAMIGIGPGSSLPPHMRPSIWVIVAGKLRQAAAPAKRELFSIAGQSLNTVLQAKMEGELTRLFMLARYAKADFRLAGIPQDYDLPGDAMSFQPSAMRQLFDEGYRGGKEGTAWQSCPPGFEAQMLSPPRSGTRFVAVHTAPSASWTPDRIRIVVDDSDPVPFGNEAATATGDRQPRRLPPADARSF
jgi:hypothetical protein